MRSWLSVLIADARSKKRDDIPIAPSLYSLSNKMDNSLLAVRDINHKYIVVEKRRKTVDLSKITIKKIRELIVFTALLVVALWKFDVVLDVLKAIWGILFPFVLGGAIAFVINVPMSFLEKKIFGRVKKKIR